MKRIIAFFLGISMLFSAVPVSFAMESNDYTQGTKVEFTAENNESWMITVPALLKPGESGIVTLSGTWPQNRVITVTADPTVTLTNNIMPSDQKVLSVNFAGISEAGSNSSTQTFTKNISVDTMQNAIFGTWNGKFNYNVIAADVAAPTMLGYYGNWNMETLQIDWYDEMPAAVSENDVYLYGDYFYAFMEPYDGWKVAVAAKDSPNFPPESEVNWPDDFEWASLTQTSYEPILESINGTPITSLHYTFYNCINLIQPPPIPETVTHMDQTFMGCTSLTNLSEFTIPESVTSIWSTFYGCTSLVDASVLVIPDGVTEMDCTFWGCTSLEKAPIIPDSVKRMSGTFRECSSLVNPPPLPLGATYLCETFQDSSITGVIRVSCAAKTDNMVDGTSASIEVYHIDGCGH